MSTSPQRVPVTALRARVPISLLTLTVALAPLSIDMFLPSLPQMTADFRTSPAHMGLAVTVFIMAFGFSQLLFGPLSDRFGRRMPLLIGLWGFVLGSLICLVATSADVLILGRLWQGLFAGSGMAIGRAVVRDLYTPQESARVFAYLMMTIALAPILAPILGGYIQVWLGWRMVFVVLGGLGLLLVLLNQFILPETNQQMDAEALSIKQMMHNYAALFSHRPYVGYVLAIAALFSGQFAFISNSAFVLIDVLKVSPSVYGWCFAAAAFGLMCGGLITSRLVNRVGIVGMIMLGFVLSVSLSWVMFAISASGHYSVLAIIIPMYFIAVGTGIVMPNASAGALADFPHMAGLASSVQGAVQMSVGALFAIGVTAAFDGTPTPMTFSIAAADTLGLLFFWSSSCCLVGGEDDAGTQMSI